MSVTSPPRNIDAPTFGLTSFAVIVLALATAAIHVSLVPAEFRKGATGYGTLFILTGVGYVIALAVLYAPVDFARPFRAFARFALIAIAAASIIAYVSLGYFDTLGWVDKAIELALILVAVAEIPALRRAHA